MDAVVTIHTTLSRTVWLFFLILGAWGLFRAIRGQDVPGSYLGAAVIGQVLIGLQVVLGGLLFLNGHGGALIRPGMHYLYAAFALVFLPFVYLYWLRGDDSNRAQWVMSFSTLFIFGVILRFGSAL